LKINQFEDLKIEISWKYGSFSNWHMLKFSN
jgi:hypothetical protein